MRASQQKIPLPKARHQACKRSAGTFTASLGGRLMLVLAFSCGTLAVAQPGGPPTVRLNFPQEIELRTLVDYVSQRLTIRILFDEKIANKRLSIKSPEEIPAESLLGLLESALNMKGLALIDAEAPGWKRIIEAKELPMFALSDVAPDEIERLGAATAVTRAFPLREVESSQVATLIKPFLSPNGANTVAVKDRNVLIVTDFAPNIIKIAKLIEQIDRPRPDAVLRSYAVQNVEASTLAQQVGSLLASKAKVQGGSAKSSVEINHDPRTNQVFFAGRGNAIADAMDLARSLDAPLGLSTKTYVLGFVEAQRIDRLASGLLDPLAAKRLYKSVVDDENNLLVATTTSEVHRRIAALVDQLDKAPENGDSPVRIYKIKNISVGAVLATLQSIAGQPATETPDPRVTRNNETDRGLRTLRGITVPGRNSPAAFPSGDIPAPPALVDSGGEELGRSGARARGPSVADGQPSQATLAQAIRVSADENTNSLIVVAAPEVQRLYADLIQKLDKRRPQVLVDAKIVILDTTDNFSLGVEWSAGDRAGAARSLVFSSFGLSSVDPVSGALSILPGSGLNFALVDPNGADAILRALTTHTRARVTSAPRILVNDNATGTLASVAEVPFTSVNASNTVATTSFAGFAEAGTTLEVTPRIAEADHLQLDYRFSLNTFTGPGGDGVPPPRQTDEFESSVTIPDGNTIIVGGLNRESFTESIDNFPFIENLPVIRLLTQSKTEAKAQNTLFVFIRPTILREDKFSDLKFLSERDLGASGEPGDYPCSSPLLIR